MASYIDCFSTMSPPMFDKENFSLWSVKMIFFLKSLGFDVFASITNAFDANISKSWSISAYSFFEANCKARFAILHALNNDDISCIAHCTSAFSMWSLLVDKFETNIYVSSPCISTSKKKEEIQSVLDVLPSVCIVAQDVSSCEKNKKRKEKEISSVIDDSPPNFQRSLFHV